MAAPPPVFSDFFNNPVQHAAQEIKNRIFLPCGAAGFCPLVVAGHVHFLMLRCVGDYVKQVVQYSPTCAFPISLPACVQII